jgi:hypothetical protein
MIARILATAATAALLAASNASFAQSTQPGQTTPSVTPSDTPAVTPSQTPAVTPSGTPIVTPPTDAPVVGGPAPVVGGIEERSVGGLSKCENMLAFEREKCLQDERAGTASTGGRPAGAGGTHAPGSTGTGAGTMGPQNTAPAGSVR